jgi:5,5'-dehydrodivanillate O-demethylase oxygenase subunit
LNDVKPGHGWRYDSGGQCVEQPGEDPAFAAKIGIRSYPTRVWLGFVFAFLGDGEPPEFPSLTVAENATRIETRSYVRKTNYLNARENSSDRMHTRFVHRVRSLRRAGLNREMVSFDGLPSDRRMGAAADLARTRGR